MKKITYNGETHTFSEWCKILQQAAQTEYDADLLEEAIALHTVGKQANRIKCATIGWKAIEEMIAESETQHGK